MARSVTKDGGSSEAEATVLFFPKKTIWEELAEAKRQSKKRAASANGTYSKLLTRLVNEEHMDRFAAKAVLSFFFIEDDSDLHTSVHHFFDGLRKLGVLDRAMIPDDYELFAEFKVGNAVKNPPRKTKGKDAPKNSAQTDIEDPPPANVSKFPMPQSAAAE